MPKNIFISYRHTDGDWVWGRLKPCLEAGGAKVLIDKERFRPGRNVYHQMDELQDQADLNLLVLSRQYFKSEPCRREMERAVATDPEFRHHKVVPIKRDHSDWPDLLTRHQPLRVDLLANEPDYGNPEQWRGLMTVCGAELGTSPATWLAARDEVVQLVRRGESVCLYVDRPVLWQPLLRHLREETLPAPYLPDLQTVDLQDPRTTSRPGLLQRILESLGHSVALPAKPGDLAAFGRAIQSMSYFQLAITTFDLVATPGRQNEYELDFFASLRFLMTESPKKLGLLAVSRTAFGTLLPPTNPLSDIDVKTVRLRKS